MQDLQLNRRVAVQRCFGERRQLAAGKAGSCAGILDDESQLRRCMPDVQRHEHGADRRKCQEELGVGLAVQCQARHAVAGDDAMARQPASYAHDAFVEFAVADRLAGDAVDDGSLARALECVTLEQVTAGD